MKSRFVCPLIDIIFKTLWLRADEDLRTYLNRIVKYAIGKDISNYHIGSNETGIVDVDNIATKVDILLESEDGKIDIELNNTRDKYGFIPIRSALNKSLIYFSYYITTYYDNDTKSRYKKPINVEQVNLNAFHCPDNYLIARLDFELCDTSNNIIEAGMKYHHIYLPRMKELCYTKDDDIYKDYGMLMCESYEEMEGLAGTDAGRCALIKMLKVLGRDEKLMTVIDKYEYEKILHTEEGKSQGIQEGIEQGISQGIEQGHQEGYLAGIEDTKKEMIISMYQDNVSLEKISKYASISIEEVKKILELSKED